MSRFVVISLVIFLYETFSMILPLTAKIHWKFTAAFLLLAGALKSAVYQMPNSRAFSISIIELPHWAMLVLSLLYNLMFIALFLLAVKDVLWLAWRIFSRNVAFPASTASMVVLIVSFVLTLYGTWEAVRVPDVTKHDVYLHELPSEFDGTKVAVLVDLHASALNRRPFIEAIVEKTNALSPDIILMPGDFVDGTISDRHEDLEPLICLHAPMGVFGTSGNHEYYFGYEAWVQQLSDFGITMLENKHTVLKSGSGQLIVAGVPDRQGESMGFSAPDLGLALHDKPANVPVILMSHRPGTAIENVDAGVTLQISGHTHGGQMPFFEKIVAALNGGYVRGWYDVKSDLRPSSLPMKLYVSRGTSLWNGLPLRILDNAEITLLTLKCVKN